MPCKNMPRLSMNDCVSFINALNDEILDNVTWNAKINTVQLTEGLAVVGITTAPPDTASFIKQAEKMVKALNDYYNECKDDDKTLQVFEDRQILPKRRPVSQWNKRVVMYNNR
jgi:hypothetical protein